MADHLEAGRDDVELFADVFANLHAFLTAFGTGARFRFVPHFDARQVRRQGLPSRASTGRARRLASGFRCLRVGLERFQVGFRGGDVGFQGFLEQVALLGIQRFALGAETDAAQMGEFEAERLVLGFGMLQCGVACRQCGVQPEGFRGLLLDLFEPRLNGVLLRIGLAVTGLVEGVCRDRFRTRIQA